MEGYQIGKDVADILFRLGKVEETLRRLGVMKPGTTLTASDPDTYAEELFGIETKDAPPRMDIEPISSNAREGRWSCDPRFINVLKIRGGDIQFSSVVFYSLQSMSWRPSPDASFYENPCPRTDFGGFFPQIKLHALVFGLGARGIGCRSRFALEGRSPARCGLPSTIPTTVTTTAK
jgi:hypothetical protein